MKTKKERDGRGGFRTGQATQSFSPEDPPRLNCLKAVLGRDLADNLDTKAKGDGVGPRQVALVDSIAAYSFCPDTAPASLPPELNLLAWRMLRALKKGDARWFKRLLEVRNGPAFVALTSKKPEPIDPVRTVSAWIAEGQQIGLLPPLTGRQRRNTQDAAPWGEPQSAKKLRRADRDVGVVIALRKTKRR
jgi:hypothetical protein